MLDASNASVVGAPSPERALRITVREAEEGDPERLARAFAGTPWDRGASSFAVHLSQHRAGARVFLIGVVDGDVVGHGSLVWESRYPPFHEGGIPEIQDLNVAPRFRRLGVASRILDAAERLAGERGARVGIGVGLHPGYRVAQRLYVLRRYVPDGRGVFREGSFPKEGERVALDDRLLLHLTKELA